MTNSVHQLFDKPTDEQESPADKINRFDHMIPDMPFKDRAFASSLVSHFEKKKSLSEKQWFWVDKLMKQFEESKSPSGTQLPAIRVGDVSRLFDMFYSAKENNIQWPAIRFVDPYGAKVKLFFTRFETIGIKVADTYEYTLDLNGTATPTKNCTGYGLVERLGDLLNNPIETMEVTGKRVGWCCLCGRTLTNPASIERGIGPICAGNWGV